MELHMPVIHSRDMPNPPLAESRQYLKRVLRETGLDLTNLARKSGIDSTTLTRACNDSTWSKRISLGTLRKVQSATGIDMPPGMDPNPPRPSSVDDELVLALYDLIPEGRELSKEERRRFAQQAKQLARAYYERIYGRIR